MGIKELQPREQVAMPAVAKRAPWSTKAPHELSTQKPSIHSDGASTLCAHIEITAALNSAASESHGAILLQREGGEAGKRGRAEIEAASQNAGR